MTAATINTIDPTAYLRSMNPRERKTWRRQRRAAGETVVPCRFCGCPLAVVPWPALPSRVGNPTPRRREPLVLPCPVCTDPPKGDGR